VELAVEDGALVARPIRAPTIRLKQLLARVTPSNRHREVDLGGATGREAW
jgi:antitoxin component of MazEF toxin-antitoxin module